MHERGGVVDAIFGYRELDVASSLYLNDLGLAYPLGIVEDVNVLNCIFQNSFFSPVLNFFLSSALADHTPTLTTCTVERT